LETVEKVITIVQAREFDGLGWVVASTWERVDGFGDPFKIEPVGSSIGADIGRKGRRCPQTRVCLLKHKFPGEEGCIAGSWIMVNKT
jgi:hypothetical protein